VKSVDCEIDPPSPVKEPKVSKPKTMYESDSRGSRTESLKKDQDGASFAASMKVCVKVPYQSFCTRLV
jgi:hypothetical protein